MLQSNRRISTSASDITSSSAVTLIIVVEQKVTRAKQCMKEGRYEDAVLLFKEALEMKQSLVSVPPYLSITDIVILHMMIGDALTSCGLKKRKEATYHLYMALALCDAHYGDEHPMTLDAKVLFFTTKDIEMMLSHSAAAAA